MDDKYTVPKDGLIAERAYRVREDFRKALLVPVYEKLTNGQKGALIGAMNKYVGDEHRRLVLGWLCSQDDKFEPLSSKFLTENQWAALYAWVGYQKIDGRWQVSDTFKVDAAFVLTQTLREYTALKNSERANFDPKPADLVREAVCIGGVVTALDSHPADPDMPEAKPVNNNAPKPYRVITQAKPIVKF